MRVSGDPPGFPRTQRSSPPGSGVRISRPLLPSNRPLLFVVGRAAEAANSFPYTLADADRRLIAPDIRISSFLLGEVGRIELLPLP